MLKIGIQAIGGFSGFTKGKIGSYLPVFRKLVSGSEKQSSTRISRIVIADLKLIKFQSQSSVGRIADLTKIMVPDGPTKTLPNLFIYNSELNPDTLLS